MSRRYAPVSGVAIGLVFFWSASCRDSLHENRIVVDQNPLGLIVSVPLPATAAPSPNASASPSSGSVVYVSLPPGNIPSGTFATLRNATTGQSVTVPVVNGGFDPVPVGAEVGDSLKVEVQRANGAAPLHTVILVPATHPPVVVRTSPPHKKTDVPLNSVISVVFSEPIATTTITSTSVQVLRGGAPVAGSVRVGDAYQLTATFTPAALLSPRTDYGIVITTDVQGFDGEPLAADVTADFTTGDSLNAAIASVVVTPAVFDTIRTLGDTFRLTALARDANGTAIPDAVINWSTSNASMPFVIQAGGGISFYTNRSGASVVLSPYASGSTVVQASAGAASTSVTVNVRQRLARLVFAVDGSVLTRDSLELLTGEYHEFWAFAADARGYSMQGAPVLVPTLSTSDSSVANLVWGTNEASAPALYVIAGKTGVAAMVATLATPSRTLVDTERVFVIPPPPVATVALAPHAARGVLGGVIEMAATVAAASGRILPDRRVTWSTSDAAVATVDTVPLSITQLATVTGHTPGVAVITATSEGQSGSATVGFDFVTYIAVSLGGPSSCALTSSGAAYCWGEGFQGALGDSATLRNPTPVAVRQGVLKFAVLGASGQQTCGLTPGGVAYCWGLNVYGQLGAGPSPGCVNYFDAACLTLTPTAVAGGLTLATINAAPLHTCALTAAGVAYCWGHNAYGALGNGLTDGITYTPTAVQTPLRFTSISASYGESCGVTADGGAYCWGDNGYGQLGDGSTTSRTAPSDVSDGLRFSTVSTGGSFACGLTVGDGLAYCWGVDQFGQLGSDAGPCDAYQDLMPCSPRPMPVAGGTRFVAISAGGSQACGLTSAGIAYCWGYNGEGQLGAGFVDGVAVVTHPVPLAVSGGLTFATIIAGEGSTCGLTTGGELYCWGLLPALPGPQGAAISAVPVKVVGQP